MLVFSSGLMTFISRSNWPARRSISLPSPSARPSVFSMKVERPAEERYRMLNVCSKYDCATAFETSEASWGLPLDN
jgi:hypothetical protein